MTISDRPNAILEVRRRDLADGSYRLIIKISLHGGRMFADLTSRPIRNREDRELLEEHMLGEYDVVLSDDDFRSTAE